MSVTPDPGSDLSETAPGRESTPSQTAGPFVSIGTQWMADGRMVSDGSPGAVVITGRVFDGDGDAVTDAMIEFWQADGNGHFPPESAPGWSGFARVLTDAEGRYRLITVRPGPVPAADGVLQAPHIDVSVFARGLMQRLVTRIYFADQETANATDPMLATATDAQRARLVATTQANVGVYEFEIRIQGDEESVFFVPW